MNCDAREIANWFVEKARKNNKTFSIMELLKLTYIAHGWHLEIFNGEPLFTNRIEAWKFGPVIPDVYRDFRSQGVSVSETVPSTTCNLTDVQQNLLSEVYNIYGNMSAFHLSDITHVEGGPWHLATTAHGNYANIDNETIRKHYVSKRALAAGMQRTS